MRLERRTEEGPGSTANAPSPAPPFRSPYRPLAVACTLMCFPPLPSLPFPRPLPPPWSAKVGTRHWPVCGRGEKGSSAPCRGGRAGWRGAARRGTGAPPCLPKRVCAVCALARKICALRARRGTGPAAGRFALPQLAAPPLHRKRKRGGLSARASWGQSGGVESAAGAWDPPDSRLCASSAARAPSTCSAASSSTCARGAAQEGLAARRVRRGAERRAPGRVRVSSLSPCYPDTSRPSPVLTGRVRGPRHDTAGAAPGAVGVGHPAGLPHPDRRVLPLPLRRTNRTRLVPPPVLTGHVSLPQIFRTAACPSDSLEYEGRDETCPVSTRGGTRLVRLVRGREGGFTCPSASRTAARARLRWSAAAAGARSAPPARRSSYFTRGAWSGSVP
jgi:hypothetical protein